MVKDFKYEKRDWRQHKERIRFALNELLKREPGIERVYLFGSYLKGYFADSNTPKGLFLLRKALGRKMRSDIDFMIDKKVKKQDFMITFEAVKYKVDYTTLQGNEEKLLVWQRGKVGILGI